MTHIGANISDILFMAHGLASRSVTLLDKKWILDFFYRGVKTPVRKCNKEESITCMLTHMFMLLFSELTGKRIKQKERFWTARKEHSGMCTGLW